MPSKKNAPAEYMPLEPVVAMQVLPPYVEVARWCGGKVIKDGTKVVGVAISEGYVARPKEYVVRTLKAYVRWPRGLFEDTYGKVESNDS